MTPLTKQFPGNPTKQSLSKGIIHSWPLTSGVNLHIRAVFSKVDFLGPDCGEFSSIFVCLFVWKENHFSGGSPGFETNILPVTLHLQFLCPETLANCIETCFLSRCWTELSWYWLSSTHQIICNLPYQQESRKKIPVFLIQTLEMLRLDTSLDWNLDWFIHIANVPSSVSVKYPMIFPVFFTTFLEIFWWEVSSQPAFLTDLIAIGLSVFLEKFQPLKAANSRHPNTWWGGIWTPKWYPKIPSRIIFVSVIQRGFLFLTFFLGGKQSTRLSEGVSKNGLGPPTLTTIVEYWLN